MANTGPAAAWTACPTAWTACPTAGTAGGNPTGGISAPAAGGTWTTGLVLDS